MHGTFGPRTAIPGQAHSHDRRILARRRRRPGGALHRAEVERGVGAAGRGGESHRRKRQHRHRPCREGGAGRLHDPDGLRRQHGDQPGLDDETAVRPGARLHAGRSHTVAPNLLVAHPSLPVRTPKDLVALARARPDQVNYASAGVGAVGHMAAELFATVAKIKLQHIPYKGTVPPSPTCSGDKCRSCSAPPAR